MIHDLHFIASLVLTPYVLVQVSEYQHFSSRVCVSFLLALVQSPKYNEDQGEGNRA